MNTVFDSLLHLFSLFLVLSLGWRSWLSWSNGPTQKLVSHIGQEKERLDKRVKVACVANVFETYWQAVLSHAFVQRKWLRLQTSLDGHGNFLLHAITSITGLCLNLLSIPRCLLILMVILGLSLLLWRWLLLIHTQLKQVVGGLLLVVIVLL